MIWKEFGGNGVAEAAYVTKSMSLLLHSVILCSDICKEASRVYTFLVWAADGGEKTCQAISIASARGGDVEGRLFELIRRGLSCCTKPYSHQG